MNLLDHSLALYASLPGWFGAHAGLAAKMTRSHMLPPLAVIRNVSAVDLASKSLRIPAAGKKAIEWTQAGVVEAMMKGEAQRTGDAQLTYQVAPTQLTQLDNGVSRVNKLQTLAVRYGLICADTTHRRLIIDGSILHANSVAGVLL